ncbi:MAG: hypothetical protein P8X74_03155 [Reinekea sp.]
MVKEISFCGSVLLCIGSSSAADQEYHWKINTDPLMALAGYVNLQLDYALNNDLSTGVMLWYQDDDTWTTHSDTNKFSAGIRLDWYDEGVFSKSWHSNIMVKTDFENFSYARSRLKLTQSYQVVAADIFINIGIGAQIVFEPESADSIYSYSQTGVVPAWEFSIGRAF